MRSALLALTALAALAVPASPAVAGPATCVAVENIPVCAGNCSPGDPVNVVALGGGGGAAYCGGVRAASCAAFRGVCGGNGTAPASGPLTCGGTSAVVICVVGVQAT